MSFLSLFPAYRLMESIVMDSRREVENLRAEVEIARAAAAESSKRFEEERTELKELREKYEKALIQIANFMAYAKTARMIFVPEDSNLPQPAPPVEPEHMMSRVTGRELVARANKKFDDDLADFCKKNREAA